MKKVIISIMTLLIASASFAQESNRDANGKIQYGPYETNSFFSNWFVEAGAGVNVPIDGVSAIFNNGFEYDFGGLAVNVNLGKWFDPCYGVRAGWYGLTTGNLDNHITFKDSFNGDHAFNYIHGDFMVNFSNLVGGYKETRAINVIPYLSAGAAFAEWSTRRSFALGGGIEASIRLGNRVSLVPEVQLLAMNSHVYGGDAITGNASATLKVRVNLGKTNWVRKATTVAYYEALNADALGLLKDAKNTINTLEGKNAELDFSLGELKKNYDALEAENQRLNEQIVKDAKGKFNRFVAYFEIGKSTLSDKEEAHLVHFFGTVLKPYDKVTVRVAGASDTATGSIKRNAELRAERASCVANFLRRTYDVDVEIVEGGIEDFDVPALSRAAVIEW